MNYFHEDLGERHQGEVVVVSVPRAGYARLLDLENYRLFRIGKRHQYNGGPINDSGHRFTIPAHGHWHVIIELPGITPNDCELIEVLATG